MQLELRRQHPDIEQSFPSLPAKTYLPCIEQTFLDDRTDLLASYVESLLTVFSNKRVLQADAETLFQFLDMYSSKRKHGKQEERAQQETEG